MGQMLYNSRQQSNKTRPGDAVNIIRASDPPLGLARSELMTRLSHIPCFRVSPIVQSITVSNQIGRC